MQQFDNIPDIESRVAVLRGKLKARDGKKEFKENCAAIRAEIDNLETRLFALKGAGVASEEKSG